MIDLHGIISAYRGSPDLGALVQERTASALTFAGRYRLVDFALSNMKAAGVYNVDVVMQNDYQSLMDHIGSGKDWDMSRKSGGIRLLPPFGLGGDKGVYSGLLEALQVAEPYLRRMNENYVALMPGNLATTINLREVLKEHVESGAGITVVCAENAVSGDHHRYITDEHGNVVEALFNRDGKVTPVGFAGVADLEVYIVNKNVLLDMIEFAASRMRYSFHVDGIREYLNRGGKVHVYIHHGYSKRINSIADYLQANMDMLDRECRRSLFPADRPVLTKDRSDVSTYYGENAHVINSLVSDGCYIEGVVKNCIISPGVHVGKGTVLENCIVMRDTHIGDNIEMKYVIIDKYVRVEETKQLVGSKTIPVVIPRATST